jgi:putative ubiquitin-RnfH superfamily antitoxin RatB of RatAB toxin-antitoxin module
MFIFIINDVMNATIATIETIANAVQTDAINERTDTINIVENDVNVINTNADTNTTNSIATKNTTTIANAIDIDATDERTNTINIDENDVSVINTNADTNVTKKITIASNEENNKERKKANVVTIDSNSNDEKMRFNNFYESKKVNTIEQNSKTIKAKNSIARIKFLTTLLTMSRVRSLTIKSRRIIN